jgi:hypothetical protein
MGDSYIKAAEKEQGERVALDGNGITVCPMIRIPNGQGRWLSYRP